MPLKSGGAVDNEYARGRSNCGLLSMGKKAAAFLYVGLETGDSDYTKGGVVKVDLIEWSKVSTLVFDADEPYVEPVCITGNYLYAGLRTAPGKIVKVDLTTFEKVATLTFSSGENYVYDLIISGDYLYAGLGVSPGKVVKVDLTTFTKVATLTLASGENNIRALALHNGYLYAGLSSLYTVGKIAKIKLSDFTKENILTLDATEQMPYSLAVYGDYLYAGLRLVTLPTPQPSRVVKIDLTTFSKVSTLNVSTGTTNECVNHLAVADGYLYASRYSGYFSKVDLSNFTWVAELAVPSGWSSAGYLLASNDYLYASFPSDPARTCKISLANFTIEDTLIFDTYDYEAHGLASS